MNYVMKQKEGLKSIHESLVSQGKFLCIIPGKTEGNIAPNTISLVKEEKWAPYFPSFQRQRVELTQQECIDLLDEAGFEPIYFSAKLDPIHFPDQASFINWLRPLVNYTSHLTSELKEEFLIDLSNKMMESASPTQDGSILFHSLLFEYLCQKRESSPKAGAE